MLRGGSCGGGCAVTCASVVVLVSSCREQEEPGACLFTFTMSCTDRGQAALDCMSVCMCMDICICV